MMMMDDSEEARRRACDGDGHGDGHGGRPAFSIEQEACPVVSNAAVNAEYRLLAVTARGAALAAAAGQFFHLECPRQGGDQPLLRRPMSVYRVSAAECRVEFLYKVYGAGTRGLASLQRGDTLDMLGPLGRGFVLPDPCRHVLLVARGVGLATLAPLAGAAVSAGARVTAILSARTPGLLMSEHYLQACGARTIAVTDEDGSSAPENVARLVGRLHEEMPLSLIATCGSNRLLVMLQGIARELGVPGQVALEQHMGCGLGMCYCCVREFAPQPGKTRYRRVCFEGPVFDLMEALPWSI